MIITMKDPGKKVVLIYNDYNRKMFNYESTWTRSIVK